MRPDQELAFAPARDQAALIRAREISPVELVDLYLARIEELNPTLNAYLTVAAEQARERARAAEADLGADELPPFHGVPISIKDLTDTARIRTTHGTADWSDRVPEVDEEVVARIRRAGFVILGKTNAPEFGSRITTESPGYPTARNPWDTDRVPGGSSGGAGAAVAAGLCPIAHGTDGGGSIRIPSAWCGIFGVKTSRGRVSSGPGPQSWGSVHGPMARTVADAAAMLDAISGYATGDAWWAPPPQRPFIEEVGSEPGTLRIAYSADSPSDGAHTEPAWRDAVEDTGRLLEDMGHTLVEDAPPSVPTEAMVVAAAGEIAAREGLPPVETLDPVNQVVVQLAATTSAADAARAASALQHACRSVVAFFDGYDALLTPTLAAAPPRLDDDIMGDDLESMMELARTVAFTPPWNQTGQPAVTIPAGFDDDGLPVGIQLVGRPADEATLLRLSAQLEARRPWRDRRPPCRERERGPLRTPSLVRSAHSRRASASTAGAVPG